MKTTILYILTFLVSLSASAQADTTAWTSAWGGSVGVGFGHRLLNNSNELFSDEEEAYDSLELASFAFYAELNYVRRLNAHLRFNGGLGLMHLGYRVDSIPDAGIEKMQLSFNYGVVPLKLQWISNESKPVAFTSSVGLVPMFLLKQNTHVSYIGDSKTDTFDTKSDKNGFGVSAHISAGIEAVALKNYRLSAELMYRQALTPTSDGDMHRLLNVAGITFSIIKTL
jgi:hypothetical protein